MMPSSHLILRHPLSSCFQSFPASGSFPVSQLFTSGGQSIGASASVSVLPMNIQVWFPLGLTGLISLQAKGLPRVFSSTIQGHQKVKKLSLFYHLLRLRAGGEGDDRGWDGWMASLTQWTWVWVDSGSWWWTGRPGVLRFMGSQRVGHDWVTELNWTESFYHEWTLNFIKFFFLHLLICTYDFSYTVLKDELLIHWLFFWYWNLFPILG